MGRYLGSGRPTVEQTPSINIRALQRAGYFSGPKHDWWLWRINGNVVGEARIEWDGDQLMIRDQVVALARTSCRFGGHRLWFRCVCGRHVSTLYSPNGRLWACRHCYELTYATRKATARDLPLLRAQRIRERLGGSSNMLKDFPPKPKGMHWRRYDRMREVHDRATNRYLGMATRWVENLLAGRGGADRPKS